MYQKVIHNVSFDVHCRSCSFHELLHILVNVHVVWSVEKCEVFMNIYAYLITISKVSSSSANLYIPAPVLVKQIVCKIWQSKRLAQRTVMKAE